MELSRSIALALYPSPRLAIDCTGEPLFLYDSVHVASALTRTATLSNGL